MIAMKGWAAIRKPLRGSEWINPHTVRRTRAMAMKAYASHVGDEFAAMMIRQKAVRFGRVVVEVAP